MNDTKPTIELPQSQLAVCDGTLQKRTSDGRVTASHRLADIGNIKVTTVVDPAALWAAVIFGAGGIASKIFLPSGVWNWTAFIILMLISLCAIIGRKTSALRVEMKSGAIQYPLSDPQADTDGFLFTLKNLIAEAKQAR